jgi:hypothetical protein
MSDGGVRCLETTPVNYVVSDSLKPTTSSHDDDCADDISCFSKQFFINNPKAKSKDKRHWRGLVYYESMKRKLIYNLYMSVGVMEDYKLRDLRASHTLGWSWNWKT